MKRLARKYGLPVELRMMPRIGTGVVYKKPEYNRTMVYAVLAVLSLMLFFFVRRGIGHRLFPGRGRSLKDGETGHMV
jgi:hypothetical protein